VIGGCVRSLGLAYRGNWSSRRCHERIEGCIHKKIYMPLFARARETRDMWRLVGGLLATTSVIAACFASSDALESLSPRVAASKRPQDITGGLTSPTSYQSGVLICIHAPLWGWFIAVPYTVMNGQAYSRLISQRSLSFPSPRLRILISCRFLIQYVPITSRLM
jgi:hypothetical protein